MATIGIDARKYFDLGIGTYIQNLVKALSGLSSAYSFALFTQKGNSSAINIPTDWRKIDVAYRKYSVSEIALLGYYSRRKGVELFHSPHYTLPIGLEGHSVVTIQDLIHLRFPQYFNRVQQTYARFTIGHAVRSAGAIITASEFTKRDILRIFPVDEKKIHVISYGIGHEFRRLENQNKLKEFRTRFDLVNPFLLYVGSVKPHKNVSVLLKAFREIHKRNKDLKLVLVGERLEKNEMLLHEAESLGVRDLIQCLGYLSIEDLVLAYNSAEVLVLPSLCEGFGFPVLESMACETPVVASNAGSLPEVAGDAAIIFHPEKVKELSSALENILADISLRKELVERGKQHVAQYSWENAARQTLSVYESLMQI